MSNILFVKANDRPADQAVSVKLYDAFLSAYKESHPGDTVTELDLYNTEFPFYGNTAITGTYKAANGFELTADEQKAASLAAQLQDQFLAADKVVFAFPLWNFTVPAPLVNYIAYLSQAGKTFNYTAEGPVGLAGDKKVALLNARGGVYSEGPMAAAEMSLNFLKTVLGLWGIQNPEVVIVEGHNASADRAEEIVTAGLKLASEVAVKF
ncbi:FMN-dependent NADH-azoreductase [Paenibacillus xylanexedens]|uniref:FMN dependent NADH:quinone oxidoreductase n=1 Tax=Paenibacillus xylanexedens TaxID=528191 RepID=A0ABS4RM72_PAEXY|nr:FMN-dependent NADH-azoreductase [Paenibacillus xylanexedens]MBP2243997.1 FMN-dependent NADH-azoreductase [Paenibacillus xylanexedens]